jgi:hypothetical protein
VGLVALLVASQRVCVCVCVALVASQRVCVCVAHTYTRTHARTHTLTNNLRLNRRRRPENGIFMYYIEVASLASGVGRAPSGGV